MIKKTFYLVLIFFAFFIPKTLSDDLNLKFRGASKTDSGIKKTLDVHESMLDISSLEEIPEQYNLLKKSAEKLSDEGKILTLRGGGNVYSSNVQKVVLILNIIDKKNKKGSIGAGSLIDRDGYIITNWHVIDGAPKNQVGVIFKDKKSNKLEKENFHLGQVVSVAKELDLALVKIEKVPVGRQPVQLSSWKDIQVGDKVHAIGHPKGLYWTYSQGIVSAKREEYGWKYTNSKHQADVIQHQTPISSGNSGGALLDDRGRLIGINTSIISVSGGADGIGFAIPIDIVKYVFKEIINNGEVIRGYVGISAEIDYKGLGVLVKGVIPDSPADVSGIRSYDIIKKIDGNAVTEIKSVQKIIGSLKPGQIVDMQVEREGKLININILVSKMYYQ